MVRWLYYKPHGEPVFSVANQHTYIYIAHISINTCIEVKLNFKRGRPIFLLLLDWDSDSDSDSDSLEQQVFNLDNAVFFVDCRPMSTSV